MVLAIVLLASGVAIDLYSTKGLTENLLYLFGLLYGSFTVGNGVEYLTAGKKLGKFQAEPIKSTVSELPSVPDYSPQLADLQTRLANVEEAVANQNRGIGYLVESTKKMEAKFPQIYSN